jgi:methionyl-tRNA formyltransferase
VKIALASSSEVSLPLLEHLYSLDEYELKLVVTNPDKATGRGQIILENSVSKWCQQKEVILEKPKNDGELRKVLISNEIDLLITLAYGRILPVEVINLPKFGAINLHYSLLPNYRGAAPVQRAILDGEQVTGVTVFKLDAGMDSGPIYLQKSLEIKPNETTQQLLDRLNLIGVELVGQTLDLITQGVEPITQSTENISFAPKFAKQDGLIDWQNSSDEIFNLYRAIGENPGVYTMYSELKIKIKGIEKQLSETLTPGEFSLVNQSLFVGTGTTDLLIHKLIPEGRKEMSGKDFYNGLQEKGKLHFA